ncbi:MAG: 2-phospho-L-lactate transferase CofD family protein [Methylococcales bacterium]
MTQVNVVLFSGGRGSRVLSQKLISNPGVRLILAINGYDDGLSTGEVRRFLGDCLGPSDFRKNASVIARSLGSCASGLIDLLDLRFPDGFNSNDALSGFQVISGVKSLPASDFEERLAQLCEPLDPITREQLAERLGLFEMELTSTRFPFDFSDCSIGNLVFAGSFLHTGRDFNRAVADYCAILGVPKHSIQNVTDGANACLVAVDRDNHLLPSEADIVDANRCNYIRELYIVNSDFVQHLPNNAAQVQGSDLEKILEANSVRLRPNRKLLEEIDRADVIVYAPGTQHSSLLPSYMTPEIGARIAANLSAVKVLITNLYEDAEIPDTSALEIIDRAVYYLREKNKHSTPPPFLITHYLLNDRTHQESALPYVPLGRLQNIEDPRLVRISNYEDGDTGRHNAEKVLTPFIEAFLARDERIRIAILLLDTGSLAKISQTILETARAGLEKIPVESVFIYNSKSTFDGSVQNSLPFETVNTYSENQKSSESILQTARQGSFDYTVLFECSGMYRGEDIVNLISLLSQGRLDAVWGSRRLSVKDIRESYQLRYQRHPILGFFSYAGSHFLSILFLCLYGRYISDVLSGARAIRASYLDSDAIRVDDKSLNQILLSLILRRQGDIFETPVQFFSLSPDKANRTTIGDGLRAVLTAIQWKFFKPE